MSNLIPARAVEERESPKEKVEIKSLEEKEEEAKWIMRKENRRDNLERECDGNKSTFDPSSSVNICRNICSKLSFQPVPEVQW